MQLKGSKYELMLLVMCTMLFTACNLTKYVPAGDALYLGAKVNVKAPELRAKERKEIRANLQAVTRPKPNKRVLGIPFKLMFWNMGGGNSPKKKRLTSWLKKWGEPPVLLSDLKLDYNVKVLQNTLENRGFFKASVTGDTVIKRKRATAIYTAQTGPQYTIRTVEFVKDSTDSLQTAIAASAKQTLLKAGAPFDLEIIKLERVRIDGYLKEHGFYFFSPDFIIIQVDSTIGENDVNLYVRAKPAIPNEATKIYRINDVYVFPSYWLSTIAPDTSKANAEFYKGYYVVDRRKQYKPKMFQQAMAFNPGDIYNRKAHNFSLNRLVNMGIFKFVKNRFEVVDGVEPPKMNAYYYLTPFPRKSIQAEFNANTKSNNLTGTSIKIGWRNRNIFRGGEQFVINAYVGSEIQYNGALKGYNTFRTGIEASILVPRFLIPFFNFNTKGGYLPRTNLTIGYDVLTKAKLYNMNSFKVNYGYLWKESLIKEHELNPISITYVQPLSVSVQYLDSARKNPTLQKAIDKQFILGSNYNFNHNELTGNRPMSGIYYNGNIDVSGNIAGLISGADVKANKQKFIWGAAFSQYVRFENEFRLYTKVSNKAVWVNRIIGGVGIPYGNSLELPFVKQFFIGGNNSVRAFRSRSVGPGTYLPPATNFLPDQSGDIKLEMNTEYRQQIVGIVHGAVFVDAGNIWLYHPNLSKPGAAFTKDFLKQLAVGTGIGLRFDISFLVLRLDVAFPLRKPWLTGEKWVLDQIKFNEAAWRKQNIVFNLAIGYPF